MRRSGACAIRLRVCVARAGLAWVLTLVTIGGGACGRTDLRVRRGEGEAGSGLASGRAGAGGTGGDPQSGGPSTGGSSGGSGAAGSVRGGDGGSGVDGGGAGGAPDPMPDCGVPGAPCCTGGLCLDGGCCVFERCRGDGESCGCLSGECHDGSCGSCGGEGQPCCEGYTCTAPATLCNAGICEPCGSSPGSICCGANADTCLDPSLVCLFLTFEGRFCYACGAPGEPCCASSGCEGGGCCASGTCFEPGSACGTGSCRDGFCEGCGDEGERCCQDEGLEVPTRCRRGLLCTESTMTCEACGAVGQRCCTGGLCEGEGCCWDRYCLAPGSSCDGSGRCLDGDCECGREGQGCCATEPGQSRWRCEEPGTNCRYVFSELLCMRCGVPGTPCCPGGNTCEEGCCTRRLGCVPSGAECGNGVACGANGSCGGCGGAEQPCCESGSELYCTASSTTCDWDQSVDTYTCRPCGGRGEPCCTRSRFRDVSHSGGSCEVPLSCADGRSCFRPEDVCP